MKQLLLGLLALMASTSGGFAQGFKSEKRQVQLLGVSPTTIPDYVSNTLIVKLKESANLSARIKVQSELIASLGLKSASITQVKQLFAGESDVPVGNLKGFSTAKSSGLERIIEIKFTSLQPIQTVIDELMRKSEIEYAEPRYIYRAHLVPNDPLFTNSNNYQAYLTQVKAPDAWNVSIGAASPVVVAIVDSGSQINHSDLAANIIHNNADPINGIDDDNDGYVDNYNGWDFVGAHLDSPQSDNNPDVVSADNAHGVHVSGLVSAVTNNGIGIASIANNYAKVMVVKVGADDNSTAILSGYEGIKYAVDHGAKVINCSWGGSGNSAFGADVVNYAINHDCLIVAAAGNDNVNQPDYPGAYPGVMAVASVSANDVKSYFSSYGTQVSIAAPGENILSTLYDNTYAYLSGTSMATPLVASAAALVKAKFPMLNMKQVADQLKITADFIDTQNPSYQGLLGQGRLNVYRALSEVPTIRIQKITLQDSGAGTLPAGDTLKVYVDIKNFSNSISNLSLQLFTADSSVIVLNNPVLVGQIASQETKSMVGPFLVYIRPTIPENQSVRFSLNTSWGASSSTESFNIVVALNYLNVQVNRISTSMTGNGRVGYSDARRTRGLGFIFQNTNLLYESALMMGSSADMLSDNARSAVGTYHEHFLKRKLLSRLVSQSAAFEGQAEFDDSGNINPLHVHITHSQVAYASAPDDKYTIVKYKVRNTGNNPLIGFYVGLYTDFDITNFGTTDATQYDAGNRMAYTYGKNGGGYYAGVKLLSHGASPAYYPLSYYVSGGPLQNNGSFPNSGKYEALSSGIKSLGLGADSANGYDVSSVLGQGPYTVAAHDSIEVAFAFIGGDNLSDLQASAIAAQNRYDQFSPSPVTQTITDSVVLNSSFPNPSSTYANVDFSLPRLGQVAIYLYSMQGKLVRQVLNQQLEPGWHRVVVDVSALDGGIYFYAVQYENEIHSQKMEVNH